jgi:hypothetical protein
MVLCYSSLLKEKGAWALEVGNLSEVNKYAWIEQRHNSVVATPTYLSRLCLYPRRRDLPSSTTSFLYLRFFRKCKSCGMAVDLQEGRPSSWSTWTYGLSQRPWLCKPTWWSMREVYYFSKYSGKKNVCLDSWGSVVRVSQDLGCIYRHSGWYKGFLEEYLVHNEGISNI